MTQRPKVWYDVRVLVDKRSYDVLGFNSITEAAEYCERVNAGEIEQLEEGRITGFQITRKESL